MSPTELANQQLLTAWVSAAAAVVQAIGTVAAIIASVVISRNAERRASAAEKAAAEREIQAEAAATARAEAAERRAEERILQEQRARLGRIASMAVRFGEHALQDLNSEIEKIREQASRNTGSIMGGWKSTAAEEAKDLISPLMDQADDAELAVAIKELVRALAPWKTASSEPWPAYLAHHEATAGKIAAAIARVRSFQEP